MLILFFIHLIQPLQGSYRLAYKADGQPVFKDALGELSGRLTFLGGNLDVSCLSPTINLAS